MAHHYKPSLANIITGKGDTLPQNFQFAPETRHPQKEVSSEPTIDFQVGL